MKKQMILIGLLFVAVLFTFGAFAQEAVPDVTDKPLPGEKTEYWEWGIAVVAPLIVTGIKWAIPRIPKVLLPLSTPLIGLGLGAGLNALSAANLEWVDMVQAGALAVFIRETVDQALKASTRDRSSSSSP